MQCVIVKKSAFTKQKGHYYYDIFLGKINLNTKIDKDKSDTRPFWINVCILWMLCFDIIDISEGIYINKTGATKKCDICHYCFFKF